MPPAASCMIMRALQQDFWRASEAEAKVDGTMLGAACF